MQKPLLFACFALLALAGLWCSGDALALRGSQAAPQLESNIYQQLSPKNLQAALLVAPERAEVFREGEDSKALTTEEAWYRLLDVIEKEDFDQAGPAIYAWFQASEDAPNDLILLLMNPLHRPVDAIVAGLLLQAGVRYAINGAEFMQGISPGDLARLALDCHDAGPNASRALNFGLGPVGPELPGELARLLVEKTRSEDLRFFEPHTQMERLALIKQWAKNMGREAERSLGELAYSKEASLEQRAGGVLALMNRDWQHFGIEFGQMYKELRKAGLDTTTGGGYLMQANLAGTDLLLEGRERLMLLRQVIGDDELADYALGALPQRLLEELAVFANDEDRAWGPYRWVEFAGRGEGAFQAGMALLEHHKRNDNEAVSYDIMHRLLRMSPKDARLRSKLDERFARRGLKSDPFWGMFDWNQEDLPAETQQMDLPRYLSMTQGEQHPARLRVLQRMRLLHPNLVFGIS